MNTPHKHAAVIKAWADGADIEFQSRVDNTWIRANNPQWYSDMSYRVKPTPPHRWQKEMEAAKLGTVVQARKKGEDWVSWYWARWWTPTMWDNTEYEFRIKPESKTYNVKVEESRLPSPDNKVICIYGYGSLNNLKLVFEGGVLIDASVIKP